VLEATSEIGGGARSSEAIIPGLLHDHCSAIHPMAVGSPFLTDLGLERYGLSWRLPDIDCVHPLDGGGAGVLHRSVDATADGLGSDGRKWRALFGRPSQSFDALSEDIMGPLLHVPNRPTVLARFGAPTVLPAAALARWFQRPETRALFGGVAAHAFRPLHYPMTSAIGLGILTAGHRHGWAVAAGGSRSITNALAALLEDLGGKIETGTRIDAVTQLPPADATMFDLAPETVAAILGDRMPRRIANAYKRFRRGPGAFKVDFAVDGGVPWTNLDARRAGTVHVVGPFAELAATERDIHAGRMPERPFVLVGQQYLADPQRSVGNVHPVWTYAHVPNGYTGDATAAIIAQIERFAPGFRERIIGHTIRSTTQMATYNANFLGGDIMTGAKDIRQLVFGPRMTLSPYAIGVPGMYICSAATPPGPGAHGMCGHRAAQSALAHLNH
jgi:phytoene dehydrogenase-like protein